jgi:cytochrome c556
MSNPQPDTSHDGKRPANGAKYLILLLVGLVIGVIATVMVLRAVEGRKDWQDHFPEAAMRVMAAHSAQLQISMKGNRCSATDTLPLLQALRTIANDLEPALPGLSDDKRFAEHASRFRATLDAALASPPLNCEGLAETTRKIGEDCKACHQDFR